MIGRGYRVSALGVAAALLHTAILAYTVWRILSAADSNWPNYWMFFLALDFPLSLGTFPVTWLVPPDPAGPLTDFSNFWWPACYHALVGTPWWYIVGAFIERKLKGHPPAENESPPQG